MFRFMTNKINVADELAGVDILSTLSIFSPFAQQAVHNRSITEAMADPTEPSIERHGTLTGKVENTPY